MDNRYIAHQRLVEIGKIGQAKLSSSKVLVVGCGGLSSSVLPHLVAAGIGNITLIDNDNIEITNLNRQVLFRDSDIGQNKALILKQRLEQQNPNINITALNNKFDLNNGITLSKEHDIVIDCSDSYTTKVSINYCCIQTKTPLVYGSVLGWDGQVALFSMKKPTDPCYKCFQKLAPQNLGDCTQTGVLGASVGIIGSTQATLAIQYLVGNFENANFLYIFDLWNLEQKKLKLSKSTDCKFHLQKPSKLNYINYHDLDKLENYTLIDIRDKTLWNIGHIPKSINLSPNQLMASKDYHKTQLVIYCNSQRLSEAVVENLQNSDNKAYILKGGYEEYLATNLKLENNLETV